MKTGNKDFIYKNDLDKACFQHDMAYGKSKDLARRTKSDKVLRDKSFEIASNSKYDTYQRGLDSMVCKFFDKNSSGSGAATLANKSALNSVPNYQPVNELYKQIIRKFKGRKLYSSFKDNIWGVDLADMQSLCKNNRGIKYLLCAIDLFSKYKWVVSLKNKRGVSIVNVFQKTLNISTEFHSKSSKAKFKGRKTIWVDQGGEFYNNLFKRL